MLTKKQVAEIMEQAQVFASAWSLVGGVFDNGNALEAAEQEKANLEAILAAHNAGAQALDPRDVLADTGNPEADRLIGRLTSADPDFDDCTDAAVLIRQLVAEHRGPDGYATWKDAAVAERQKRVAAERTAGAQDSADDAFEVWKDDPRFYQWNTMDEHAALNFSAGWNAHAVAHPQPTPQTDAARDVMDERKRQVEVEGWTTEHDDGANDVAAMADAAACYAMHAGQMLAGAYSTPCLQPHSLWPWDASWWKPTTPRRDLVKAGALILAEIERIDRIAEIERLDGAKEE